MQETTAMSRPLEMGDLEDRDIITTDGRIIGQLKGAWIDTSNWSVASLVVDLNKDVVEELNVKKPILKAARVNLPTTYVAKVADIVQLNVDMTTLSGAISTSVNP
ncbi:MAG: hypothetical protein GX307_05120 [Euryarchaeota archaeon]|nr:hypothetical protein [Euryarchaeota archaeon]